jgi:hypothetical protein
VSPTYEWTFNAQMDNNRFPSAGYYQFAYSPNLTATPEPSCLLLFGTGLLGLMGLSLKKAIG